MREVEGPCASVVGQRIARAKRPGRAAKVRRARAAECKLGAAPSAVSPAIRGRENGGARRAMAAWKDGRDARELLARGRADLAIQRDRTQQEANEARGHNM